MENVEKYETGPRLRRVVDEKFDGNASELARAIGMNPSTFYKYVNGDRRPGPSVLVRLAQLGINLHWLLTGEGTVLRASSGRLQPLPLRQAMSPDTIDGPDASLHHVPFVQVQTGDDGPYLREVGAGEWLTASRTFSGHTAPRPIV